MSTSASGLLCAACAVLAFSASSAEYWVDNVRGDDAAEGTRVRPFGTMTRAAAAMRAGDIMNLVANDEPYRESLTLDQRFAKMSAADGAPKAVIDGHGAVIDGRDRRPLAQWRDEGGGVWSSHQPNNCWVMDRQGHWSGRPIVFRGDKPLEGRTSRAELEPDTYFLRKEAKRDTPEAKDAHNRLYVKLSIGETPDRLLVPVRRNGICAEGVSNVVVRNVTAQYHYDDGFDTCWMFGVEFENVRGCYNMDQGISAHSSGAVVRRSRFDHNAGSGAVDTFMGRRRPETVYEDCLFDHQTCRGSSEFYSGFFTLRRCAFLESPGPAVKLCDAQRFEVSDCVFSNGVVKTETALWIGRGCTGTVRRCTFSGFPSNYSCESDSVVIDPDSSSQGREE